MSRILSPRKCAAAILIVASVGFFLTPRNTRAEIQIFNEFSIQSMSSTRKTGQPEGAANLSLRDFALASRWRYSMNLMKRHGRQLDFLVGPYLRLPFFFSMSGYGEDRSTVKGTEFGLDLGLFWFGYARTLLSGSPGRTFSFQTASELYEFNHSSVGFRIEVPAYRIEAEPGDERVQIGGLIGYQLDWLTSIDVTRSDAMTSVSGTQKRGRRWSLGAFINVRI